MPDDGLVVVDKPAGWTSHDVVGRARRLFGTRRVGHAGTLDPMATGVLLLGVGRATRLLTFLVGCDKSYRATVRLGERTLTDDAEGEVTERRDAGGLTSETVAAAVARLTGPLSQVPSAVSAVKVGGRRSYARVRAGEDVELAARQVTVHRFDVLGQVELPGSEPGHRVRDVEVEVEVSSGTYVRALARDLGESLGVGGHLTALRRTCVGPFTEAEAASLEELATDPPRGLLPAGAAAARVLPVRQLTAEETQALRHGRTLPLATDGAPEAVAALDSAGALVAVLDESGAAARSRAVFPPAAGS
ncbi:tRNA pseudouridine(55) synthase TruB [Ornithinicoccus halotolerans]|uniref:tRNA pseudouridine(55) synthase TruB n=1 Tax=Ornithinicoccus halotolerans TaxID=1748220 RepID=UPI001297DB12|nr:tRNA pseudouridine(55) synthase TruB [Ornithinicoccus halotolerans]